MTKLHRTILLWAVPLLLAALYGSIILTNAHPSDFFRHIAWGSNLYANAWEHLRSGSLTIDPTYAPGEYFIVGPGKYIVYFGLMPALVRGIGDIFVGNIYLYNFTNLSMVIALLVCVSSVLYAVRRLVHPGRSNYIVGGSIVLALLLASPLSYILAWSWTYHEVILWGLAWSLLFISVYAVWVFDTKHRTWVHGLLLGLAVGMAVLCRPTIALTLILPYAYLCVHAIITGYRQHNWLVARQLGAGMAICALLAAGTLAVNYQRWGSPLTFVQLDKNVQLLTLYPERAAALRDAGEFNLHRLPYSLHYYFMPSSANFSASFPFVTLDRKLDVMDHAPQYDYIEGSRVPVLLSALYLVFLAGVGLRNWRCLRKAERTPVVWLIAGGTIATAAVLMVYAAAVRYSVEFLPLLVFLSLLCLVTLPRQKTAPPTRLYVIGGTLLAVSIYMTQVTMLGYKEFIWDQPPATREHIRQVLHYHPTSKETKHIINGKRYPVY